MTNKPRNDLRREIKRLSDLRNEAATRNLRDDYTAAIWEVKQQLYDLHEPQTFTAVTVSPSGVIETRELFQEDTHSDLQDIVGGLVEPIQCGELTIWMNDEGLLRTYYPNPIASTFAFECTQHPYSLVGDVVITGPQDEFGRFQSVKRVKNDGDGLAIELI